MFKIRVFFKSNEKGIYTEEIETASEEIWRDSKYDRALNKWFSILCESHGSCGVFKIYGFCTVESEKYKQEMEKNLKLYIIQQQISLMNKFKKDDQDDAKFEIEVIEE